MITACKNYITEHNYRTIWEYQQEELIEKLQNCIKLNQGLPKMFPENETTFGRAKGRKTV